MHRKVIMVVIFAFFFLFVCVSETQGAWSKYPDNPVLAGNPGEWNGRDIQCGKIIKDESLLSKWYAGNNGSGWQIGLTTSNDGINWENLDGPIITSSNLWGIDTNDPIVIKEENIYKMWFSLIGSNWQAGADRFRVGHATSPDGVNWDLYDGWVLTGTSGTWDSGGIARGISVIKDGAGYKMWYAGVNEGQMGTGAEKWQIGYATSPDGINWIKHTGPVISPTEDWELNSVSYPHVIFEGDFYHMWYTAASINLPAQILYAYSSDGINWIKPAERNPALTTGESGSFDSKNIASPFVIKDGNTLKMWYSGLDSSGWSIGYAEKEADLPTPSPTPGVEPDKIVFLPGLGASWNHSNMIFGLEKPSIEWRMTPGVKIYNGLLNTLETAGYSQEEDQNLFVFNYNWTQPVMKTVLELKNFINQIELEEGEKIDLIGHSMGGLVARSCAQLNPELPIDQIVTLGSPHRGVPHLYFAWEGGQAGNTMRGWSLWQRIGIGLILTLRRDKFESPVATVQKVAPGIKDLLPTFDYLKKESGSVKNFDAMIERNSWLENLNHTIPASLLEQFYPVAAVINKPDLTLRWIEVKEPNWLEKLLGLWADGRPTGREEYNDGDKTVLKESAQINGAQSVDLYGLDHVDLATHQNSITKVCEILGLEPDQIISGEKQVKPSLLFLLGSPAQMEIIDPQGNHWQNEDNFVLIENPSQGDYQANLLGLDEGKYDLYVLFVSPQKATSHQITGLINPQEEKNHRISLTENKIDFVDPQGQQHQQSAQAKLSELEKEIDTLVQKPNLKYSLQHLITLTNRLIARRKLEKAIATLYKIHLLLSRRQTKGQLDKGTAILLRNHTLAIIDNLQVTLVSNQQDYAERKLKREQKRARRLFQLMEKRLNRTRNKQVIQGTIYQQAKEELEKGLAETGFAAHLHFFKSKTFSKQNIILL